MVQIDDLWGEVIRYIYDKDAYVEELKDLLQNHGVTRQSLIIDSCAGSGFPSLDLLSDQFNVLPLDGTQRMIELFNQNAKQKGLDVRSTLLRWEDLPQGFTNKAKAILCRGNSIIYAGNSWGKDDVDIEKAKAAIQQTLKNFYDCLGDSGILYIDKFHKDETAEETIKGRINIFGIPEQLLWRVEHDLDKKTRRWILIREQPDGKRFEYANKGYLLMYEELRMMLLRAGFKKVEEAHLDSETTYTAMLAYK